MTLELRPYQREGVEWMRCRRKALLIDEMGLGKTPQALRSLPAGGCALVVAPAVVKPAWADEARAWVPDFNVSTLSGRGSFRWPERGEIVITNYEILPPCTREVTARRKKGAAPYLLADLARQAKNVPPAPLGVVIVADEAHRLGKNKTIQTTRFRALRSAAIRADGRAWGLTGTPLLNRPLELWNLVTSMALQGNFGSWPWFCRAFNAHEGRFGMEWGKPNLEMLVPALKRIAKRRLKRDVLPELPEKVYRTLSVPLGENARRLADAALEALVAAGVDLRTATAEALNIAEGKIGFEIISRARAALAAAKTEAAVAIVEEFEAQDTPLLVVSDHRRPVEEIGSRPGWGMIHGEIPAADRGSTVRRFQAGELRGVALTIGAGGVGITLTRAADVLRVDRNWTPALNDQVEDRAHRFGQTRGVVITDLVADHYLDERIAEILQQKTELASVIDAVAN